MSVEKSYAKKKGVYRTHPFSFNGTDNALVGSLAGPLMTHLSSFLGDLGDGIISQFKGSEELHPQGHHLPDLGNRLYGSTKSLKSFTAPLSIE